jgi:hypothetical protein
MNLQNREVTVDIDPDYHVFRNDYGQQESESIVINDKSYSLETFPLSQYFEKYGEIILEPFSSQLTRGYKGEWEIKNDKLYLNKIKTANTAPLGIFKSDQPIFADWYSGQIKIGIGEIFFQDYDIFRYSRLSVFNSFYQIFTIEKGIIKKSFIVEPVYDDCQFFEFGKYRGLKLINILKGGLAVHYNTVKIIKEYLTDLLSFFLSSEQSQSVLIPNFDSIIQEYHELSREVLLENHIECIVTRDSIALSEGRSYRIVSLFCGFLEKLLKLPFSSAIYLQRNDNKTEGFNPNCLEIKPGSDYIIWAINNVRKFYVLPHIMDDTHEIFSLECFKCKRLSPLVIGYKPAIKKKEFVFPENIKRKNLAKFQMLTGKLYDKKNGWYLLSENEQDKIRIKYFNSESNSHEIMNSTIDWSAEELQYAGWQYDRNNPAHDEHENPWIDVFGPGDEADQAYWNTV